MVHPGPRFVGVKLSALDRSKLRLMQTRGAQMSARDWRRIRTLLLLDKGFTVTAVAAAVGSYRRETARVGKPEQYSTLVWDDRSGKREEHPGCRNDLADSAPYAWRRTYQYLSVQEPAPPVPGTPEWAAQEEAEMLEAALLQYRREHADSLDPWSEEEQAWQWRDFH